MTRRETTRFLSDLLVRQRLSGRGKYWAREVSIDYGTTDVRRIDFLQFDPPGQISVSDIEKGLFICYEVKSCREDFFSGHGQNFIGDKNYLVMPMEVYKELIQDIPEGIGVLVPVPEQTDVNDEFQSPTVLSEDRDWKLCAVRYAFPQRRKRAMVELLFCMLRSRQFAKGEEDHADHELYNNSGCVQDSF